MDSALEATVNQVNEGHDLIEHLWSRSGSFQLNPSCFLKNADIALNHIGLLLCFSLHFDFNFESTLTSSFAQCRPHGPLACYTSRAQTLALESDTLRY